MIIIATPILLISLVYLGTHGYLTMRVAQAKQIYLSKFKDFYKNNIIIPLLKNIGTNITYLNDGFILQKHNELKLYDISGAEDMICMNINGVDVEFGEIVSKYITGDDDSYVGLSGILSDYSSSDGKALYLRDLVLVAIFNKNFNSSTFIINKSTSSNSFKPKLMRLTPKQIAFDQRISSLKQIELDSPNFNKFFTVFTDNELEARYILTHTMMEKMLHLHKNFSFSTFMFKNNKIIFTSQKNYKKIDNIKAEHKTYDLFDYDLEDTIFNQTQKHFEMINTIKETIKILQLDSKIWK